MPLLATIQNLKAVRPDLKVDLMGPCPELLEHHPDITRGIRGRLVVPKYDGKTACDKGWNFVDAYHYDLQQQLQMTIPRVHHSPKLYLSPDEDTPPPYLPKDYCLVVSGGKRDLSVKHWGAWNYQKVVDAVSDIQWVQIGHEDKPIGNKPAWHHHPRLNGCIDLIGRTNTRELMRVIRHARVLLCGITLPMWIAAAFSHMPRPPRAVIICGGREPSWFINQPNQIYHCTAADMPMCGRQGKGCWLSRTEKQYDGFFLDWSICTNQLNFPDGRDCKTPKCMQMIDPLDVVASVRQQLSSRIALTTVKNWNPSV